MAIITDIQEDQTETKPSSSSAAEVTSFRASFDRSNPLGFLEKVFDFIAEESNFLDKDTAQKEIATVVRAAKQRKEKSKAEEKVKEEPRDVKKEEPKKVEVKKEKKSPIEVEKKEAESGLKGKDYLLLCIWFKLIFVSSCFYILQLIPVD